MLQPKKTKFRRQSVENKEICFNVYIYNVQPNIEIDYSNGYSKLKQ